jgi:hypothetical protein
MSGIPPIADHRVKRRANRTATASRYSITSSASRRKYMAIAGWPAGQISNRSGRLLIDRQRRARRLGYWPNTLKDLVTLSNGAREERASLAISGGRDCRAPHVHRRGGEASVCLG